MSSQSPVEFAAETLRATSGLDLDELKTWPGHVEAYTVDQIDIQITRLENAWRIGVYHDRSHLIALLKTSDHFGFYVREILQCLRARVPEAPVTSEGRDLVLENAEALGLSFRFGAHQVWVAHDFQKSAEKLSKAAGWRQLEREELEHGSGPWRFEEPSPLEIKYRRDSVWVLDLAATTIRGSR